MLGGTYSDTFVEAINYVSGADRSTFLCANELYYLVRNSLVTWPEANCNDFLAKLVDFWNQW